MKLISKYSGVLLAAVVLTTTVLKADDKPASTPPAGTNTPKLEDLLPDDVVAKGKGFEIKRSNLDEVISGMRANISAQGRELTPADLPMLEKYAFDHVLQIKLFTLKATDDDKAKGKVEAAKRLQKILANVPSEEKLVAQLKSIGLSIEGLRSRLTDEAVAEQVLRDRIVPVTDAEVKKFYDDNPEKFEEPEMVRASHILIMTNDLKTGLPLSNEDKMAKKKIIDDLLKRARAGEDFAKLAKEYSDDPGSKDKGGEYTFPRGQMAPEFEAAAFTLKTNQISDIITTKYGYHIIKLSEKIPAKKLEFDKVSPDIRSYLEGKAMGKILPEQMALLKKDADVQIVDEQLKTMIQAADEAAKRAPAPGPLAP
jgi:peptidyl-prolyl cis-trans isomerase C